MPAAPRGGMQRGSRSWIGGSARALPTMCNKAPRACNEPLRLISAGASPCHARRNEPAVSVPLGTQRNSRSSSRQAPSTPSTPTWSLTGGASGSRRGSPRTPNGRAKSEPGAVEYFVTAGRDVRRVRVRRLAPPPDARSGSVGEAGHEDADEARRNDREVTDPPDPLEEAGPRKPIRASVEASMPEEPAFLDEIPETLRALDGDGWGASLDSAVVAKLLGCTRRHATRHLARATGAG